MNIQETEETAKIVKDREFAHTIKGRTCVKIVVV